MKGKNAFIAALAILAVAAGYLGYQQFQRYRALKSGTINAVLECKENLNFLYDCENSIRQTGDEMSGMVKAQAGIQRTLKDRDIRALLRPGIENRKKDAMIRILNVINSYNALLSTAFYGSSAGSSEYTERPVTTGEMINEFLELEKILEGK